MKDDSSFRHTLAGCTHYERN